MADSQEKARWPGWEALDDELRIMCGNEEGHEFRKPVLSLHGASNAVDNVGVHKHTEPQPHWHYVTYGLTELFEKTTDDPDTSGYGFELTFRLVCDDSAAPPPAWPANLLERLARYVKRTGNVLRTGDSLDLEAPLGGSEATGLTCCLVVDDPVFSNLSSEHGDFSLRQLVGLTKDEYDVINTWNGVAFAELFAEVNPLMVTDLGRAALLADPEIAAKIDAGRARDGSSLGRVFATVCAWEQGGGRYRIRVDTTVASTLGLQLRGRLGHQRPLALVGRGPGSTVTLRPGTRAEVQPLADGGLEVTLPPALADALSQVVRGSPGRYSIPELRMLEFEVVPRPAGP